MVRVNFSMVAIFLGLAVSSTALPTKASVPLPSSSAHTNQAAVELAYEVLKTATEMVGKAKSAGTDDLQGALPEGFPSDFHSKKQASQSEVPDPAAAASQAPDPAAAAASPSGTPSSDDQSENGLLSGLPIVGGLLGGGGGL